MTAVNGTVTIFESESAAGSRPIPLGDSGRSYGQSVTFRKNRFFVRLVGYDDSAGSEAALINLARGIAARLPDEGR